MASTSNVNLQSLIKRSFRLYRPYFGAAGKKKWHTISAIGILIGNFLLACFGGLITVTTGSLLGVLCLPGITYAIFWTNTFNLMKAIFLYALTSALNSWNVNWLKIALSKKINKNLIKKWMSNKAYYNITSTNPAQIMGRENSNFNANSIDLTDNFLLICCNFSISAVALYSISAPLSIALLGVTLTIPGYLLFSTILYAIAYNYFLDRTAAPLKKRQKKQRKAEADLIENIGHVKAHAESIAFKNGSRYEQNGLLNSVKNLSFVQLCLAKTCALLHFVTTFHAQLSSVIAMILYAPNIISKNINDLKIFELTGYFYHIVRLFTWKRDNIDRMTACELSLNQVEKFDVLFSKWKKKQNENAKLVFSSGNSDCKIKINKLTILTPKGAPILKNFTASLVRGKITLVSGKSGSGKTSLFRSIAGLSEHAKGSIKGCSVNTHFIPSQPYFPLKKTLLDAILYPRTTPATEQEITQIKDLMKELGFKYQTIKNLQKVKNWYGSDLSDGEKKRIEIVSAIFKSPDVLFMDEATSGVDSINKLKVEKALKTRLRNRTIVYTDHTSNEKFYDRKIKISRYI